MSQSTPVAQSSGLPRYGAQRPESGALIDGPEGREHCLPLRVYYEDTDFSGLVYHARYLHFLERGRTDFLRLLGFDQAVLRTRDDAVVFAVHHMDVSFHAPAQMDDAVLVVTRFTKFSGARLTAEQVLIKADGGDGESGSGQSGSEPRINPLVSATVQIAALTPDGRPRRLPRDMRAVFLACLGGGSPG